jgi:hypothetical protein
MICASSNEFAVIGDLCGRRHHGLSPLEGLGRLLESAETTLLTLFVCSDRAASDIFRRAQRITVDELFATFE